MLSDNEDQEQMLQKCILPFGNFCNALHEQVSGIFASEIPYWKTIESQCAESGLLIKEHRQSTFKSARWLSRSFDAITLRTMSTKLMCSDEHIILTAFGRAMSSLHGKDKTAIVLESHGRQLPNVDSTSTVGWCTSKFPFVLETLQTDGIMKQVKQVEEKVKQIPYRGLGFGLLKAEGKLTIPLPNIMFVFQGSLDASTKQTFDGGKYKFDHIPWSEVMMNELRQGRFHRHPEEILEFDLEIITWIHGGHLKFGCLFDTETISETLVETLVKRVENNLKTLAKEAECYAKVIKAEIIPFFNITPECVQTVKDSLMEHDICAEKITVCLHDQALQSMVKAVDNNSDVTVIISRHTTDNQAVEFSKAYNEFKNVRSNNKVVTINAETLPNSVKLPAQKVQMDNSIVQLPSNLGVTFYNRHSDVQYGMPFTQEGYSHIGLVIARSIRARIDGNKYKVIAFDADYTLWDGECAHGLVNLNTGNIFLQKFLLRKKGEGMLLVILSKNSYQDVVKVFETQKDQMILSRDDIVEITANWNPKTDNIRHVANQLNLALGSFVFIDDNALECEEMVTSCPEVLSLQLPSKPELVGTFLDNLWILDNMDVTRESSERTEMYRNDSSRQKEMENVKIMDAAQRQIKLTELLAKWKMKMTMLKTNVSSLKQSNTLFKRAAELLHRTNQFKLNDVFTRFSDFKEEDLCWLISLEDCHGSYGVVSVCIIEESSSNVKQWVLSCRALGRMVERRILFEILRDVSKKQGLQLSVSQTERNVPIVIFLESLGCSINKTGLTCVTLLDINLSNTAETLHKIEAIADTSSFEEKIYPQEGVRDIDEEIWSDIACVTPMLKDVIESTEVEW
jgi:FkbH-like protein/non-ribosomal peptide synthase protein (TIGR01720 family)